MQRIRLRRMGARKRPSYRIVVIDSRLARDGAYLEKIGRYDPMTEPATVQIDQDKAAEWIKKGAQPSERVAKLMQKVGILPGAKT